MQVLHITLRSGSQFCESKRLAFEMTRIMLEQGGTLACSWLGPATRPKTADHDGRVSATTATVTRRRCAVPLGSRLHLPQRQKFAKQRAGSANQPGTIWCMPAWRKRISNMPSQRAGFIPVPFGAIWGGGIDCVNDYSESSPCWTPVPKIYHMGGP